MKKLILLLIFMPWFAQAAGLDYLLNGVTTPVKVDTATPANSRPYPFAYYSLLGARTELAADATLAAMSAKLPATLGQKTSANSLAVVMASDFVYPLPTGAATAANQVTANGYLSSIDTKVATEATLGFVEIHTEATSIILTEAANGTTPLRVLGPLTDTELRASPVPVSAASLPLPTGAATETTLAAINTKTPALGQALAAASVPVVLASNQPAISVTSASVIHTGTFAQINNLVATAQTLTAPANTVGWKLQAPSTNTENISCVTGGAVATITAGILLEPGRSEDMDVGGSVSCIATSANQQRVNIIWKVKP